ncbi:hypothetical protein ACFZB4_42830 [Streptomyces pseudovenezuelae]|uniref:hypothetical protein n=1 Tax=Streptomyces pseudovenezuelae TaxID=67350 RepID=UPI0036EC48B6
MATSYAGVAALMIEAGINLFKLAELHGDTPCRTAHDLLQVIIGIVDDRAHDAAEAEERLRAVRGIPTRSEVKA